MHDLPWTLQVRAYDSRLRSHILPILHIFLHQELQGQKSFCQMPAVQQRNRLQLQQVDNARCFQAKHRRYPRAIIHFIRVEDH